MEPGRIGELEPVIIRLFKEGWTEKRIADHLGISKSSIHRVLIAVKTDDRCKPRVDRFTKQNAIRACIGGMSIPDAADKFGLSTSTLNRALRAANVELPTGRPRVCAIDDTAFDELTPLSLYWMGFLFADGHQGGDGQGAPYIRLALTLDDREHVEKFRDFLKSTHAITVEAEKDKIIDGRLVHSKETASFKPRSALLVEALRSRGMTTKKEERDPIPELAQSRDFWRGVVDGDGTLYLAKGEPAFTLCGHQPLLGKFQRFIAAELGVRLVISADKENLLRTNPITRGTEEVAKLLYENACEALTRKKERADLIISHAL